MSVRICPECGGVKLASEFRASGYCKPCANKRLAEWRKNNKEKKLLIGQKAQKKWRESNPGAVALILKRHRSAVKTSTPRWADFNKINDIYKDAREFRESGLEVHVDHIIPLQGELVSGLHVPENLTIKLARWNESKGNSFHVE